MDHPRGRVIAVRQDAAAAHALIEVDAAVQCLRCREGRGCGAGLLGAGKGARQIDALIGAGLNISEGDEVSIELAPRNVLRAAVIVYGAPLVAAVVAAGISAAAGLGDLYAALAAVGGILAGVLLGRRRLRHATCLRDFTPTVVQRIKLPESTSF